MKHSLRIYLWPLVGLAALLVFNAVWDMANRVPFAESFFQLKLQGGHLSGNLVDVLNQGAKIVLLALGMTLVIATGGIDLSVGAVMAIAGAATAGLVSAGSVTSFPVVLAAVFAAAVLIGAVNGSIIAYVRIQPIVATLIMMILGRGIAMLLTNSMPLEFSHSGFSMLGRGYFLGLPIPVVIVCVTCAGCLVLVRRTAIGLFIEAVGDNPAASRLSGVRARGIKMVVYVVSACCAALAGVIQASNVMTADPATHGRMLELDAIFAVVVGGTALTGGRFLLAGSIVGALIIQTLSITLARLGVPSAIAPVPKALVIVVVCLMQAPRLRTQVAALLKRRAA